MPDIINKKQRERIEGLRKHFMGEMFHQPITMGDMFFLITVVDDLEAFIRQNCKSSRVLVDNTEYEPPLLDFGN